MWNFITKQGIKEGGGRAKKWGGAGKNWGRGDIGAGTGTGIRNTRDDFLLNLWLCQGSQGAILEARSAAYNGPTTTEGFNCLWVRGEFEIRVSNKHTPKRWIRTGDRGEHKVAEKKRVPTDEGGSGNDDLLVADLTKALKSRKGSKPFARGKYGVRTK